MNMIVNIIFRLLNLTAFVALLIYFFQKYFKKNIIMEMDQKARSTRLLLDRQESLEHETQHLDSKIEQEQILTMQLQEKVTLWTTLLHMATMKKKDEKKCGQEKLVATQHLQQNQKLEMERHLQALTLAQESILKKVKEQYARDEIQRDYFLYITKTFKTESQDHE